MKSTFFKLIVVFLLFSSLFIFSEFLYLSFNNRLYYFFGSYCFYGVKFGVLQQNQIFDCFENASSWVYRESTLKQEVDQALIPYNELSIESSTVLSTYLYDYAKTYKIDDFFATEQSNLAKVYYLMALHAYQSNDNELTEALLQRCIVLAPHLSYCHVELGNFYLSIHKTDLATAVLARCQRFKYASEYCTIQLDFENKAYDVRPVGFLLESMNDYYAYKI